MTSDEKKLWTKAAAYCSRSEHCLTEVEEKLRAWGADRETIRTITDRLIDDRFLDHRRYASFYVRDKFRFNGWGRQKIAFALREKRIERPLVNEALEEIDEQEYLEKLSTLIASKRQTLREVEGGELQTKLFRFAVSRGFEFDLIKKAIGASDEQFPDE